MYRTLVSWLRISNCSDSVRLIGVDGPCNPHGTFTAPRCSQQSREGRNGSEGCKGAFPTGFLGHHRWAEVVV